MAWRDHIDAAFGGATAGDRLADAKQDMPIPDRIALARELLAGTGLVVAWDVGAVRVLGDGGVGWNACRRAMLEGRE